MKRKLLALTAVVLIGVIGIGLWFYGYYNLKSNDNIPSRELMEVYYYEKGEEFASEKLEGYRRSQLIEVWGEPQGALSGPWGEVWVIDGTAHITVCYRRDNGFGQEEGIVDHVKVVSEES